MRERSGGEVGVEPEEVGWGASVSGLDEGRVCQEGQSHTFFFFSSTQGRKDHTMMNPYQHT